jgi:hypothetical protein
MMNPEDMQQRDHQPRLWDIILLPLGAHELSATPEQVEIVTVGARTPAEARELALADRPGHHVVGTETHGTVSPMVLAIRNRARRAADAKERQRWDKNGPDADVREIVGSRVRGGGW